MDTISTIAQQVDHMKPEDYIPGIDVGMVALGSEGVRVIVLPTQRVIDIVYDEGADLYNVEVSGEGIEDEAHSGVFCDQLGELCFGSAAKPWTQPFGSVTSFNPDGSVATHREF